MHRSYKPIDVVVTVAFSLVNIAEGTIRFTMVDMKPGNYHLEPIDNPVIDPKLNPLPWYVVKGTQLGWSIEEWEKIVPEWPM